METASGYRSLNLDLLSIPALDPSVPVLSHYFTNMYSAHHLDTMSKPMTKAIYSDHNLRGKDSVPSMNPPKKENLLQSMFNAFTTRIGEISRVPGMVSAGISNSLSVTVVPNEGIISHEFFKSLTGNRELTSGEIFIPGIHSESSIPIIGGMHSGTLYAGHSILENHLHWKGTYSSTSSDCLDPKINCNSFISNTDELKKKQETGNHITGMVESALNWEKLATESDTTTSSDSSWLNENSGLGENIDEGINMQEEEHISFDQINDEVTPINNCSDSSLQVDSKYPTQLLESMNDSDCLRSHDSLSSGQAVVTNLISNMWQKVVNSISGHLNLRTDSLDSDIPTKRPYSPKSRRKLNCISSGRGRGRAKSQLRRSGVSQTRHRQERIRQNLSADIKDDLDCWKDYDMNSGDLSNSSSINEIDSEFPEAQTSKYVMSFTLAELKPRRRKQKVPALHEPQQRRSSMRVRYKPGTQTDVDEIDGSPIEKEFQCNDAFRPRLVSESSVDSEDSYCIVFEARSESDYDTDSEYTEISDEDDVFEQNENSETTQKVRFNLVPIVHSMVTWDYAYRAARKGPWEEIARDRERFKSRIHRTEHVLGPILTAQHRKHIWEERFNEK